MTEQDIAAQLDAARAEVARMRAWMPKWRRWSGVTLWSIWVPNSGAKLEAWNYTGQWYWAKSDGPATPATDRDAAMRAAEVEFGLPQCEVCDEP